MKNYKNLLMSLALVGMVFFSIRFEIICWKYTRLYNLVCNAEYWFPAVACFLIFLYFYLKSDHKRR